MQKESWNKVNKLVVLGNFCGGGKVHQWQVVYGSHGIIPTEDARQYKATAAVLRKWKRK